MTNIAGSARTTRASVQTTSVSTTGLTTAVTEHLSTAVNGKEAEQYKEANVIAIVVGVTVGVLFLLALIILLTVIILCRYVNSNANSEVHLTQVILVIYNKNCS